MAKRVSTRRIKKDRLYTYEDAAELLGVSVQTVRSWRALGLVVMSDRKPHYILGEALIEFLEARQTKRAVKMAPDQVLCLSCRAPRRPYGMMLDYVSTNASRGRLIGLCEVCDGPCQRFASRASLETLSQIFDIATGKDQQA